MNLQEAEGNVYSHVLTESLDMLAYDVVFQVWDSAVEAFGAPRQEAGS